MAVSLVECYWMSSLRYLDTVYNGSRSFWLGYKDSERNSWSLVESHLPQRQLSIMIISNCVDLLTASSPWFVT